LISKTTIISIVLFFCVIHLVFPYKSRAGFEHDSSYYTGSGRFSSGKTCLECHTTKAAADIFDISPQGLPYSKDLAAFVYSPGTAYLVTVSMKSDNSTGSDASQNGFSLEILDSNNKPAGRFEAVTKTQLSTDSDSLKGVVLNEDDPTEKTTLWTFNWTSPVNSSGALTLYFAGVDGNGDGLKGDADKTDAGSFKMLDQSAAPTPGGGGCGILASTDSSYFGVLLISITVGFTVLVLRRLVSGSLDK